MNTSFSNETSTEHLFECIEKKLHLLEEMQAMALEQSDLVAQHDMSGLMSLLSKKQSAMESLQDVQVQLNAYKDQDPETRVWESAARRKTCQEMVSRCDQLVRELIVQENRSLDNMNLQRESILSQLNQNAAATEIHRAYQASTVDELDSSSGLTLEG